jgi:biotin carboxylase
MKTAMIIGVFYESDLWIKKTKELGYNVVAVHPMELSNKAYFNSVQPYIDKFYKCSYVDYGQLLNIAKSNKVEMVVTHPCSNDALVASGYVNSELGLKGVSYSAALKAGSKFEFHQLLEEYDLPRALYTTKNLNDEAIQFPCIVKPNFGAGSIGVKKIASRDELDAFFISKDIKNGYRLTKPEYDYYLVQDFMQGERILGCNGVVRDGEVIVFGKTMRNLKNEVEQQPYFYGQEFITTYMELSSKTKRSLEKLISGLQLDNCPFKAEILIDEQDEIIGFIEINLRPAAMNTAIAFDYIYGFDNASEQIKLATDLKTSFEHTSTEYQYMMVKNLVFKEGTIESISWPPLPSNIISFNTELKSNETVDKFLDVNAASKNGHILIIGKEESEIYGTASSFVSNIKIKYVT